MVACSLAAVASVSLNWIVPQVCGAAVSMLTSSQQWSRNRVINEGTSIFLENLWLILFSQTARFRRVVLSSDGVQSLGTEATDLPFF